MEVFTTSENLIALYFEKFLGQTGMSEAEAKEHKFPYPEYLRQPARPGMHFAQLDAKIWSDSLKKLNCFFINERGEKFALLINAGIEIYGTEFRFITSKVLPGSTFKLEVALSQNNKPFLKSAEMLMDMREVLRAKELFCQKAVRTNARIREYLNL